MKNYGSLIPGVNRTAESHDQHQCAKLLKIAQNKIKRKLNETLSILPFPNDTHNLNNRTMTPGNSKHIM